MVTEGQTKFKISRLSATPKDPVVDRGLLGSDGSVLDCPHAGHAFPTGKVLAVEDRSEVFFNFEEVKGYDCGKQP